MKPRRKLRCLLLRLAACVVIGAAATVLVAWGTGVRPWPADAPDRRFAFTADGEWFVCHRTRLWWFTNFYVERLKNAAPEVGARHIFQRGYPHSEPLEIAPAPFQVRTPTRGNITEDWHAGFPARAMWCGEDVDRFADMYSILGWPRTWRIRAPDRFARWAPPGHPATHGVAFVPYGILPIGFALDTALYGTLAFALWSAPGFAKRGSRRRRRGGGRCIACGYELKGLEKCPECGAS